MHETEVEGGPTVRHGLYGSVVSRKENQGEVLQRDRKAECRKDLGEFSCVNRKTHDPPIKRHTDTKKQNGDEWRSPIGIDPGQDHEPIPRVHPQHQEFAVGEIDNFRDPENEVQAQGSQCVNAAEQDP